MSNLHSDGPPVVYVIDDDESLRDALASLFRSVGMKIEAFASANEFLRRRPVDGPSCLVLDVRLPGVSGLDFQEALAKASIRIPIVFMTGHGDIPMTVKAMKAGAVEFLIKPFREQDMLDAVQTALTKDRERREIENTVSAVKAAYDTLSPREREVLLLVAEGLMNKQVADRLGVSEITVKVHRKKVMQKMNARSFAELVRMVELVGIRQ